ncbi:MAG: GNAT family N-acetyltransferase [Spirosomataceae bacterium]
MPNLRYIIKKGFEIEEVIQELAHLRITVFRAFPYLYEGSFEYEKEYLKTYINSSKSFLFSVYDGDKMVGATTCIPLSDETPDVQEPFIKAGMNLDKIFYFGESILLPEYRGFGLGHRFFDERESHAASFGTYSTTCFCGVVRPENHPLQPTDYKPLDEFWTKRGYKKQPQLQSQFDWLDIGEQESTTKPMIYWSKEL